MTSQILPATPAHRDLLRRLFELYCHDFSPMTQADLPANGWWTDESFLDPWPNPPWEAFLFKVAGHWAGFAWVTRGSFAAPRLSEAMLLEEFFILRKYRRRGWGKYFATTLFHRYPGPWEVGEIPENVEAQAFWRVVIGRYTRGAWWEVQAKNLHWTGPVQLFNAEPGLPLPLPPA